MQSTTQHPLALWSARIRAWPRFRFLAVSAVIVLCLLVLFSQHPASADHFLSLSQASTASHAGICSPADYSAGHWQLRVPARHPPNVTVMRDAADAYTFSGFSGCASNREVPWHLATDNKDQYSRFPAAHDYEWIPGPGCKDLTPWSKDEVVMSLVRDGGWLLLGDSVSENHFFSLSCLLHPHVRATPDYSVGESFDRAWPQHLYLSPSSPLLKHITLPPHFNIETTPLVSFRRNDVLFSRKEMEAMYPRVGEYTESLELFSEEKAWFISPEEYMPLFTTPRPEGAGYSTMIVSTGGHWTTGLFRGLPRLSGVRGLFIMAMQHWAEIVQGKLAQAAMDPKNTVQRRVLVRAYLPGNEKCHERRAPFTQYPKGEPYSWNWGSIQDFNKQMEGIVAGSRDIHYLEIQRPGMLRPDAHSTQDCLHFMTGAGVMEGWSEYMWHYISRELA